MKPETSTITGKEARAQMVMFLTGARDIGGVTVDLLTTRYKVRRSVAEAALCDEMRRRAVADAATIEEMKALAVRRIVGPTIMLGSGTYFDFEDPESALLTPEDFAYGLAGENRFSSQCVSRFTGKRVFYNVAEHCVRMSYEAPSGLEYAALMHEGGETPCGDMSGPLKSICPDFKRIEKRCEAAAHVRFRVLPFDPDVIKLLDLRMLATEKRDLMPMAEGDTWSWTKGARPFDWEIREPWTGYEAAERFLRRYAELAPPDAPRIAA